MRLLDSPPKRLAALCLAGALAALAIGTAWMALDRGFGGRYFRLQWLEAVFDPDPRWFDAYDWLVRYGFWGTVAAIAFIVLFDRARAAYVRASEWVRGAPAKE